MAFIRLETGVSYELISCVALRWSQAWCWGLAPRRMPTTSAWVQAWQALRARLGDCDALLWATDVLTAALQVVLVAIIVGDADRQHESARRDGRGYQHKQRQHQDDCDFLSHSINILL